MLTFFAAEAIYLTGALVTLWMGERRRSIGWVAWGASSLATVLILACVIQVFTSGPMVMEKSLWQVPGLGASLLFRIDYLSALFLAIISIISVLVTLYAQSFMQIAHYQQQSLRYFYTVLLFFFAAVIAVVAISDLFFFFIFWEMMTLSSYLLVIYRSNDATRTRAGFKYFFVTHVATAFLFIGGLVLYLHSGSFSFIALKSAMMQMQSASPGMLHLVLGFFLVGFATKAGILPMGDWLPDAYPAAPAPASAGFAGSMTKLGIYGVVRVFCDFLPAGSHSQVWGLVIACLGAISILVGTMTALVQEDAKRLLSFHVIGQMGYMFLAIGTGIYFLSSQPVLAIIALGAGIFHLINHVSYKSCLFFNAGSVFYKVGTRDINKIGGLATILPWTAGVTVIASLSIAGIPPFSGFSSKWLIYEATLRGGFSTPVFVILGLLAIFVSAVTLASFIKFIGSVFYGKYADNKSKAKPGDVPLPMRIPQFVLAGFCIVFGLFPRLPVQWVYRALIPLFPQDFVGDASSIYGHSSLAGLQLQVNNAAAGWQALPLLMVFVLCTALAYYLFKSAKVTQRADQTWFGGEPIKNEDGRYRAHSYYLPFKQIFRIRIGKYERSGVYPTIRYPDIHLKKDDFWHRLIDVDLWFFNPLVNATMRFLRFFSNTHSGLPHVYLLWMLIGVLVAVVLLFSFSGIK